MLGLLAAILLLTDDASAGAPPAPSTKPVSLSAQFVPPCAIPVYINVGTASRAQTSVLMEAVVNAVSRWNNTRTGVYFAISDFAAAADRKDGAITISVASFTEDRPDEEIGLTYNVGTVFDGINRTRIVLDAADPWCLAGGSQVGCYQIENVIVHELGHAVGLKHVDSLSAAMYVGIAQSSVIKDIAAEDIAAMRSVFPRGNKNCEIRDGVQAWSIRRDN